MYMENTRYSFYPEPLPDNLIASYNTIDFMDTWKI